MSDQSNKAKGFQCDNINSLSIVMKKFDLDAEVLRARINLLETQLLELKTQLAEVSKSDSPRQPSTGSTQGSPASSAGSARTWPLEIEEYTRYGRQMIMPEVGLQGKCIERVRSSAKDSVR